MDDNLQNMPNSNNSDFNSNMPTDRLEAFLQKTIENYTQSPSADVWDRIDAGLDFLPPTPATNVVPNNPVWQAIGTTKAWLAGSTIAVLAVFVGQYVYLNQKIANLQTQIEHQQEQQSISASQQNVPNNTFTNELQQPAAANYPQAQQPTLTNFYDNNTTGLNTTAAQLLNPANDKKLKNTNYNKENQFAPAESGKTTTNYSPLNIKPNINYEAAAAQQTANPISTDSSNKNNTSNKDNNVKNESNNKAANTNPEIDADAISINSNQPAANSNTLPEKTPATPNLDEITQKTDKTTTENAAATSTGNNTVSSNNDKTNNLSENKTKAVADEVSSENKNVVFAKLPPQQKANWQLGVYGQVLQTTQTMSPNIKFIMNEQNSNDGGQEDTSKPQHHHHNEIKLLAANKITGQKYGFAVFARYNFAPKENKNHNFFVETGGNLTQTVYEKNHTPQLKFKDRKKSWYYPYGYHVYSFDYELFTPSGSVDVNIYASKKTPYQDIDENLPIKMNLSTKETQQNLSIPLQVGYQLQGHKLGVLLKTGIIANILLKNNLQVTTPNLENNELIANQKYFYTKAYKNEAKKVDIGFAASVGANWHITKRLSLEAAPVFTTNLTKRNNANSLTDLREWAWGGQLGLTLGL